MQSPSSVNVAAVTVEGGCIVIETSELLWKCGLVRTKESWLIYLATQDSTNKSTTVPGCLLAFVEVYMEKTHYD